MKSKNLVILAVVAAVLVGLAYMSSQKNKPMTQAAQAIGKPVFEALQQVDKLNAIERIVFQSAGSTVVVSKVGETWVAPGKYSYPVKYDKVHDFVRMVANLKIGQPVTGDRSQMEELGLVAPGETIASNRAPGTLVQFLGADGLIDSFVVGQEHKTSADPDSPFGGAGGYADGRYLSAGGKACLVWESMSGLPASAKDWLDTDLVSVPSGDITAITLTNPEGKSLMLKRPDGNAGELTLDKLSKKEVMNTTKVNSVAGVLSYLTFEDVADPALADQDTGLDKPAVYVATAQKGRIYTLKIGGKVKGSDDRYCRLGAEFVPPPVVEEKDAKAEKKDEPKPAATNLIEKTDQEKEETRKAEEKKKKEEELKKLQDEIRDLNAKVGKWVYILKSYKVGDALVTRDQLVEDKDKKEAEKKAEEKKAEEAKAAEQKGEDKKEEAKSGEKKGFFGRLFGGGDDDEKAAEEKK